MVDLSDKLDKLKGKGSDDKDSPKKKKKKKKKKSSSGGGNAVERAAKGAGDDSGSSGGRSVSKPQGDGSDDIRRLLLCIGNILAYTEGAKLQLEQKKGKQATERLHATKNIHDESLTFMSAFNVQEVAERHGFDWEDDVLNYILQHQDFEEMVKKYN